ncbi:MAG TPA: metal ABC transporter permease [Acidimicrobiales bacterium]|nr:metal ABC transporter permease [Acidimicrobiales bacterium]
MVDTWTVATIAAVIAGAVGFFVVMRGSAFPAHAIPNGAFAGAAAANVLGVNELLGLAVCAVGAALGIAALGRRARHDVATALALVVMLAAGTFFLSRSTQYEAQLYALLFGEVLGAGSSQVFAVGGLGVACAVAVAFLYRPLLLSSVVPEMGAARGVRAARMEAAFLGVLALATALTVPVVGALLIFSLMIGPPAAARAVAGRPSAAMALSVALALITVWAAIALSYVTNWPIGFFVGSLAALCYGLGRAASSLARP